MESSKITAGRIDASEAMIVPVYDTTPLVGEEGFMVMKSAGLCSDCNSNAVGPFSFANTE